MKKKLLVVFLLLVCFWHFNVKAEGENENISNGSEMTQQERITEDEEDKSSVPKSSDSSGNNGAGTSDLTSPTTLPNDGDSSGETATSSGNTEDGTGETIDGSDDSSDLNLNIEQQNDETIDGSDDSSDLNLDIEQQNDETIPLNEGDSSTDIELATDGKSNSEIEDSSEDESLIVGTESNDDETQTLTSEVSSASDIVENGDVENNDEDSDVVNNEANVQPAQEVESNAELDLNNNEEIENEVSNYNVTFSYNGHEVSVKGGSKVLLSSINRRIGIDELSSNIDRVTISNNDVLTIYKNDEINDWVLVNNIEFATEEILKIHTLNGKEYLVKVTDPAPDHSKILRDNGDGTYTIALTVTGDAEKQVNKANVVIILDTSNSMDEDTGNGEVTYTPTDSTSTGLYGLIDGNYVPLERRGRQGNRTFWYNDVQYTGQRYTQQKAQQKRIEAAKDAVNNVAYALLSNNGNGNPDDTVELALIDFNMTATTRVTKITSYDEFSSAVNALRLSQGTNWEAALRQARLIDFDDNDQVYIIFVSDGNPSVRLSPMPSQGYNPQDDYDSSKQTYYDFYDNNNEQRAYDASVDEAVAIVENGNKFYTIGVYGNVNRLETLTQTSGAPTGNYYSASDTAALQEALSKILQEIEMAGIGSVQVNDGTTSSVSASSGSVGGGMLDVADEDTFKYWLSFEIETDEQGTITTNVNNILSITKNTSDEYGTYTITVKNGNTTTTFNNVKRVPAYGFDEASGVQLPETEENRLDNIFKFEWEDGVVNPFHKNLIKAYFEDGAVKWDLKDLGVLQDKVTYTVTFDCWPSQVTLDLIADLKNSAVEYYDYANDYILYDKANNRYTIESKDESGQPTHTEITEEEANSSSLDIIKLDNNKYYRVMKSDEVTYDKLTIGPEVAKYLLKNGNDYTLLTNTEAALTFKDTREENPENQTSEYDNPDAVSTAAIEEFAVSKIWVGTRDEEDKSIILYIDRDGDKDPKIYGIELNEGNNYTNSVYVSIGIMTVSKSEDGNSGTVTLYTTGRDYSFSEDQNLSWRWELTAPIVRPMMINGEISTLFLKDGQISYEDDGVTPIAWPTSWPEGNDNIYQRYKGHDFYRIDGKIYRVGKIGEASLTAKNEKRSNLDINKTVSNGLENDTQLFTYEVTIETSNKEDYWFSIWDNDKEELVTDENCLDGNKEIIRLVEDNINIINVEYQDNKIKYTKITNGIIEEVEDDYVTISESTDEFGNKIYNYTTGYYYAKSGDKVTLKIQKNWNLRILNVPTGSTYTIKEIVDASPNYTFESINVTYKGSGEEGAGVKDETAVINNEAVSGEITLGNKNYRVAYTNKVKITSIKVTKIWDDVSNQDGKRSGVDAKAKLYILVNNNEEEVKNAAEYTIGFDDDWNQIWTNLPVYASGNAIKYIVKEILLVANGYTNTISSGMVTASDQELSGTVQLKNSYTPAKDDVIVTKVWEDESNKEGFRPESIKVTLKANGDEVKVTPELVKNNDNTWTLTYKDLDVYAGGKEIVYTIEEEKVANYNDPEYDQDTLTVTNTRTVAKDDVIVTKVWEDESNKEGFRPESIKVTLKANGEEVKVTPELVKNEDNTWTFTYKNLDVYAGGEKIVYTIEEEKVANYNDPEYDQDTLTVTNTHKTSTVDVVVRKVWDDNDNQDGIRPESIKVTLSNGDVYTLNEENGWLVAVEGLPKYADGKEIKYTWTETVPEGYEISDITVDNNLTTITNTHTPETISVKVTKVWADDDNESGKRPASITITLLANGKEYDRVVLSDSNDWKHTFNDLPAYNDGEKIEYSVVEENVPEDYEVSYEGDMETGFIVHNVLGQGGDEPPEPPVNPQTGDNVLMYLITLLIGIIGFISSKVYIKENN